MKKKKWHVLIRALLVWLMAGMLSGCIVRIDLEPGGQERQISEKQIQADVSGGAGSGTGQAGRPEADVSGGAGDGTGRSEADVSGLEGTEESEADISGLDGTEKLEADVSGLKGTEKPEAGISAAAEPGTFETGISDTDGFKAAAPDEPDGEQIDRDGLYTDKDQVALYIHLYGQLPGNYITKSEAEKLGWDSGKGNLEEVAPGKSIGGGRFGNREELLPKKKGRSYYECDIDYDGGYRGAKRIVYSDDGLIYYTEDHYKTFELLYTSEGKAE